MKTTVSNIYKLSEYDFTVPQMYNFVTGTHKIASLERVTYDDLVRLYGEPSILHYRDPDSDGKIQVEWVFEFLGQPYTIYDWKTYDRDYTLQELTTWSIGGQSRDLRFFEALQNEFSPKFITINY